MRTLVMNLTRFGDLLQTQPIISGLTDRGNHVEVVCLENFQAAAKLLRDVDTVHAVPGAKFLSGLEAGWQCALSRLFAFKDAVLSSSSAPISLVANMTPALSARLLSRFFGEQHVTGFAMDELGFGKNTSPWATFLEASSKNRGMSPFNLVDLMWQAAGLGVEERVYRLKTPLDETLHEARELLDAQAPESAVGYVGFQLGASVDRRRWPLASFVQLGERLWQERALVPVLFGAKGEVELASRYIRATSSPCIDLIGKTGLDMLAALLKQLSLLVTNDTGTMHLAAGLEVPIVAVFLSTAQPFDTGPYRAGSICLEPDMDCHPCSFEVPCPHDHACRNRIDVETMERAVALRLDDEGNVDLCGRDVRAWRSYVDSHQFIALASLSGHDHDDRTLWIDVQRHFYRQFFDDGPITPYPAPVSLSEANQHTVAEVLARSSALLELLVQQGMLLERKPSDVFKSKFMTTWQTVQTLWANTVFFSALGRLWLFESQEQGQDFPLFLRRVARYAELIGAMRSLV
ncbi:glycosyltransferase family 9 protein [Desulfovibrio inopinatus]|uniref:glycosyltransferase family 9 protein n=1 Tax=Desulfovibrio inopinatus TaxID=102109 RepID=UPI0004135A65|nr:glycosyltransferase family 9 protein [Desulfovibrio inopinatus]